MVQHPYFIISTLNEEENYFICAMHYCMQVSILISRYHKVKLDPTYILIEEDIFGQNC